MDNIEQYYLQILLYIILLTHKMQSSFNKTAQTSFSCLFYCFYTLPQVSKVYNKNNISLHQYTDCIASSTSETALGGFIILPTLTTRSRYWKPNFGAYSIWV